MTAPYPLIDADAHVNPPATFWKDYMPAKLVELCPRIEPGAPGDAHDWIVFEGTRKPLSVLSSVAGRAKQFKAEGRMDDIRKGSWEPPARLADMDADGVYTAVMYGGGPLGTLNNDLYLASFQAYNEWLADFCAYDPKRFAGVAYLPMQDVNLSIQMLKDAAKRGLKACNIPAFPQSGASTKGSGFGAQVLALTGDPDGPRQYMDPEFDPFWKAAVDHNMAITIHLGARFARPGMRMFLPNLVMSKVTMAEPIAIMIFGGVFDKFPELRFGSIESGVGWFSWMAQYMDDIYDNQRHWLEVELKHQPSHYMDKNIYGSFIRDPLGIANRNKKGGRNIMWSTDYPHSETTWPASMDLIEKHFAGLSDEERRPVVSDNARRFYAL